MLPVGQRHGHTTAGGRRFIGRQHVRQDGGQHEYDNDPYANERGAFAPQLPPGHRLETLSRSDRLGYFHPLVKNNRLTHALLLPQRASPNRLPPWLGARPWQPCSGRLVMYPLYHTECADQSQSTTYPHSDWPRQTPMPPPEQTPAPGNSPA